MSYASERSLMRGVEIGRMLGDPIGRAIAAKAQKEYEDVRRAQDAAQTLEQIRLRTMLESEKNGLGVVPAAGAVETAKGPLQGWFIGAPAAVPEGGEAAASEAGRGVMPIGGGMAIDAALAERQKAGFEAQADSANQRAIDRIIARETAQAAAAPARTQMPKTFKVGNDLVTVDGDGNETNRIKGAAEWSRAVTPAGLYVFDPNDPKNGQIVPGTSAGGTAGATAASTGAPVAGAAGPKLTETQTNLQIYGTRMKEAEDVFKSLEPKMDEFTKPSAVISGNLPNLLKGVDWQKYDQAKRNFVNAVLRRESGAVISPAEFVNAEKQYFPQPGDAPQVIEQKRMNRATVISEFERLGGRRAPGATEQPLPVKWRRLE